MKIKDHNKFIHWIFHVKSPIDNKDLCLPIGCKPAKNLLNLTQVVLNQMNEFDKITNNDYTKKGREIAESYKMEFPTYMMEVIEHQLCLRSFNPKQECWSSGAGDRLHQAFSSIDVAISNPNVPKAVQRIYARVVQKITPSKSKTLGGCSRCGGTRIYDPKERNEGRAGRMNKI